MVSGLLELQFHSLHFKMMKLYNQTEIYTMNRQKEKKIEKEEILTFSYLIFAFYLSSKAAVISFLHFEGKPDRLQVSFTETV